MKSSVTSNNITVWGEATCRGVDIKVVHAHLSSGTGWSYTIVCFYRYLQIILNFKRHNIPLLMRISSAHQFCCMSHRGGLWPKDIYVVVCQLFSCYSNYSYKVFLSFLKIIGAFFSFFGGGGLCWVFIASKALLQLLWAGAALQLPYVGYSLVWLLQAQ